MGSYIEKTKTMIEGDEIAKHNIQIERKDIEQIDFQVP